MNRMSEVSPPVITKELLRELGDWRVDKEGRQLAEAGQTIVVVEQNISAALSLAHRLYIINNGHIVHEATAQEIKTQPDILRRYLGV